MKKTKQKLPKWFDGQLYDKGDIVKNPYSGEECKLTAVELSMYDFVMGASTLYQMGMHHDKLVTNLRKGLNWFRKHNAKAYMALLD
jgi:hypothetical protein